MISAKHLPRPLLHEISVAGETIHSVQKGRTIGTMFDNHFCSLTIMLLIQYLQIFVLSTAKYQLRKYLSATTTELLVHMFVSSKLDYCNALLYGLPTYTSIKSYSTSRMPRRASLHLQEGMIILRLFFLTFTGFP